MAAIPRRNFFDFFFNDGRGIHTTQLEGAFVERIETLADNRTRIHYVKAGGIKEHINIDAKSLGSSRPGFLPTVSGTPQSMFGAPANVYISDIDIDSEGNVVVLRDDRHVNRIQLATTGIGNSHVATKIAVVDGFWVVNWSHNIDGDWLATHNPATGAVVDILKSFPQRRVIALGRQTQTGLQCLAIRKTATDYLSLYGITVSSGGAIQFTTGLRPAIGQEADVGMPVSLSIGKVTDGKLFFLEADGNTLAYTFAPGTSNILTRAANADENYHGAGFTGLAIGIEKEYLATTREVITFVKWHDKFVDHIDTPDAIVAKQQLRGNAAGTILEFVPSLMLPPGITRVGSIPGGKTETLLNLIHDEYVQAGAQLDVALTPGYIASGFFGYSDGMARPNAGSLAGTTTPLAWLGGGTGTINEAGEVTSWQPVYVGSHSRDWITQFTKIKLGAITYDLSGLIYDNGIWEVGIANPPTFANGNAVNINFLRADGTAQWRAVATFSKKAGLYWYGSSQAGYGLLQSDSLQNRGVHSTASSYTPGDVVTEGKKGYLATAAIGLDTALTDSKWLALFGISIDVVAALPTPANVHRDTLVAIGKATDTGLSSSPHYRREMTRDTVQLRADPLGAGRTGFTTLQLQDNLYQGKALAFGGTLTPAIPGVLALYEQPNTAGGTQVTLVSEKTGSIIGALDSNIRVDLKGGETLILSHAGLVNDKRTWVGARLAHATPFLKAGSIYNVKLYRVSAPAGFINLHAGDYLSPLIDPALLDVEIADAEQRLLQESENSKQIISLENDAVPEINIHNYERVHIYHRSPRAWIGQKYPTAKTSPATATSAFTLITGHWRGAYSIDPAFPGINDNDVYYNRTQHAFRKRVNGVWVSTGFSEFASIYTNVTSHWLGERNNANDAAGHVPLPIDLSDNYFFYSRSEGSVEQIVNNSFVAPVGLGYLYRAHALVNADDIKKEFLADHTLYTDKNATGMHISPLEWIVGAKIEFTRALTAGDDDRIIACHFRWEERNPTAPTSKTQGHHRSFAAQIDGLTFRTLGERVAGVNGNSRSMTESADWYVRQPNWRPAGNFNNRAEMRISYGRERLADGRDAIRFLLAAGDTQTNWAADTRIFNFQGRFVLHH